jgi:hypothetical protein
MSLAFMVKFARESSVVRTWADARAFCWLRRQACRWWIDSMPSIFLLLTTPCF